MRLKSISLSKLHQAELISFVEDVLQIMKKHDLSALHIKDASEMLIHYYPQVIKLAREYGPCSVVNELNAFHIKRVEYAGSIFTQVHTLERLKGESLKNELLIARLIVQLHLKGIRKHNRANVNGKLWNFFNTLDNDPKTKDSFQKLGLLDYVEELRDLDKRYNELYDLRCKSKAEASKRSENKGIQNRAEELLRLLFLQLQQAQLTYPELEGEYLPLFSQLNHMIPHYTKLIRTRATLNKKRAAAKAKAKAEAESKVQIVCVDGKQTGTVVIGKEKPIEKKGVIKKKKVDTSHRKFKQRGKKTVVATKAKNLGIKKDPSPPESKTDEKKPANVIKAADITRTKTEFLLNGGQVKGKNDYDDGS